ncbi:MAG: AMP-binding protein [Bacillota bacterium]
MQKDVYLAKPWTKFYVEGVPEFVEVPQVPLLEVFEQVVKKYAKNTAINFYGKKITYQELGDHIDRLATALADLGLKKGDRIALYLLNSPQFVISYLAVLKIGAIVTPINPVYTSIEVKHQLSDSGAKTIICQDILYDNVQKTGLKLDNVIITGIGEYLPFIKKALGKSLIGKISRDMEIPDIKIAEEKGLYQYQELLKKYPAKPPQIEINPQEHLAVLAYTGGTTGPPKGAMLTHYNLMSVYKQVTTFWPVMEEGKEVVIAFLPFYHIYGQIVAMFNSLFMGATIVLFTTVDLDDILLAIDGQKATFLFGVPTFFEYLKEHDKTGRTNWKRLKLITCGADTLHETTVDSWKKRTGTNIVEGYGMTETTAVTHANPMGRSKKGSFGLPMSNVVAAVINPDTNEFIPQGEVGEMIVKGPNIMQGYWQAQAETDKVLIEKEGELWLKTGDFVKMDEEGYFFFYDRKRDLIKYKGYSVFARDIEDYLYQHPQIKQVGVIGVPEPTVGQLVKANIVLQNEARGKVSEEDILDYCRQGLAHYKIPKIIEFRGELPQTDVGKISRRELREELEEF